MVGIQKLWYKMPARDVLEFFDTDEYTGLRSNEIPKRAKAFGYNPADTFTDGTATFYQYLVIRSGRKSSISADKLVLGDVIVLKKGNIVPANLRLVKVSKLQVDEEKLTGNYAPKSKNTIACKTIASTDKQHNMVFAGSKIISGTALAVVVDFAVNKVYKASKTKQPKLLNKNNFYINDSAYKQLKNIDTIIFDDLQQSYEVTKTIQQIFLEKNISCVYLLSSKVINDCKVSLPNVAVAKPNKPINNLGKEVLFVDNPSISDKTKIVTNLKNSGANILYVYRGEEYIPAAKIADISLVINKESSQQSLFFANVITNKVHLKNLSSILYNKK